MRYLSFVAVVFSLAILPSTSQAWSLFAHELVCEIAYQELTPTVRREVIKLSVGQNSESGNRTFAESCKWADSVRTRTHRETYEYHFINVPRGQTEIDFSRDCAAYDCVSQAVVRYAKYLNNQDLEEDDRAEALRFLGHFVGDIHQPLHVGYVEDRGGNLLFAKLSISGSRSKNLHSIWDGTLAERLDLRAGGSSAREISETRRALAKELLSNVQQSQKQNWNSSDVQTWARESFELAKNCAYKLNCDATASDLRNGDYLSNAYYTNSEPIIHQRLLQAGVRLAHVINLSIVGELRISELDNN